MHGGGTATCLKRCPRGSTSQVQYMGVLALVCFPGGRNTPLDTRRHRRWSCSSALRGTSALTWCPRGSSYPLCTRRWSQVWGTRSQLGRKLVPTPPRGKTPPVCTLRGPSRQRRRMTPPDTAFVRLVWGSMTLPSMFEWSLLNLLGRIAPQRCCTGWG